MGSSSIYQGSCNSFVAVEDSLRGWRLDFHTLIDVSLVIELLLMAAPKVKFNGRLVSHNSHGVIDPRKPIFHGPSSCREQSPSMVLPLPLSRPTSPLALSTDHRQAAAMASKFSKVFNLYGKSSFRASNLGAPNSIKHQVYLQLWYDRNVSDRLWPAPGVDCRLLCLHGTLH